MEKYRVIVEVERITGKCPVYKNGDRIVLDSQYPTDVINLEETNAVCMRALQSLPFRLVYQVGSDYVTHFVGEGRHGEYETACPLPGEPYTACGGVTFRIRRVKVH